MGKVIEFKRKPKPTALDIKVQVSIDRLRDDIRTFENDNDRLNYLLAVILQTSQWVMRGNFYQDPKKVLINGIERIWKKIDNG